MELECIERSSSAVVEKGDRQSKFVFFEALKKLERRCVGVCNLLGPRTLALRCFTIDLPHTFKRFRQLHVLLLENPLLALMKPKTHHTNSNVVFFVVHSKPTNCMQTRLPLRKQQRSTHKVRFSANAACCHCKRPVCKLILAPVMKRFGLRECRWFFRPTQEDPNEAVEKQHLHKSHGFGWTPVRCLVAVPSHAGCGADSAWTWPCKCFGLYCTWLLQKF